MENPVATGIKGFDSVLGGGLFAGSCILLMAPPQIESKLFYLEYIYRGIQAGEPGLIVTMDSSPETLKTKAAEYGWDMNSGEKKSLLRWVDGYSLNAKKEVESTEAIRRIGGSIALSDLTIGITKVQQEYAAIKPYYRYVFDSLSTLFIYNDPNTIYRFLRVIISKMRASNGVGFLTLGEGIHDPSVEMTLRYMVDGTLHLDDHLRLNVLNLPAPSAAKGASLALTKEGFSVEV
jgi:KaiC/GvpD/RAD55 family RecA-like ATPase